MPHFELLISLGVAGEGGVVKTRAYLFHLKWSCSS
jgi:hypothetical protein